MAHNYYISLDHDALLDAVYGTSSTSSSPSSSRRSSDSDASGPRMTILVDVPIQSWDERFDFDPPPLYSRSPPSERPPSHTSAEDLVEPPSPSSSPLSEQLYTDACSGGGDESSDPDFEARVTALRCEIYDMMRDHETRLAACRLCLERLGEADPPPLYSPPPADTLSDSLLITTTTPSSLSPWVQVLDDADPPPRCSPPPVYISTEPLFITAIETSSPAPSWVQIWDGTGDSSRDTDRLRSVYSHSSRRHGVCVATEDCSHSVASSDTLIEINAFDWDAVGAEDRPPTSLASSLVVLCSGRGQESRSHSPEQVPVMRRRQRLWSRICRVFRCLRRC